MDVLSDLLRAVRLTGAIYFDVDASSPWVGESPGTAEIAAAVMPGVEHIISFHAVLSGSCWAALADGSVPPLRVNAGDVVVFPGGAPNVMSSSPGARGEPNPIAMYYRPIDRNLPFALIHGGGGSERTRFVCGYLGCDARPFNPLLAVLPDMLCARKPVDGNGGWVTDLFQLALAEGGSGRAGGETILAKLSELMFVGGHPPPSRVSPRGLARMAFGPARSACRRSAQAHSLAPHRGLDIGASGSRSRAIAHHICGPLQPLCRGPADAVSSSLAPATGRAPARTARRQHRTGWCRSWLRV